MRQRNWTALEPDRPRADCVSGSRAALMVGVVVPMRISEAEETGALIDSQAKSD